MDILVEWVTQIILFIILATIIDLLIPQTAMKKYINLVVGLILILILLNPIFHVLNIDIESALNQSFSQIDEARSSNDSVENLIEMQKKDIEMTQDAYILEQMAVPLIDIAKDPLMEEYQLEITNIDFNFQNTQELTYEDLVGVIVYVKEIEEGEGEMGVVEDVVINTDDPIEREARQDEEVKERLMELWELHDKELMLYWEGGAS
ncbi:stage III sporulation protein AF [Oceanobacillus bengalensis]|uniref:Stage III sporulation protein AF n=1 Tax=Oceanobacillus bengalensis TaxID=1435466 RepID=A0A494Z173_9BACI|nr:stage III sporulation protein AF [Oceanobacillus bengalensis]RKQ16045.1 stage III sporulation protein AF [Oceanobacillus bengalensis]